MILFIQHTSNQVCHEGVPEQNPFDINARVVVGFREIGKGHPAIENIIWIYEFYISYGQGKL